MGCRHPLLLGQPPGPTLHLLSSLSFSYVSCVAFRLTRSFCLCPNELLLLTGLPGQTLGLGSPPCLGLSTDRFRFQYLALPSVFRPCGAAPHRGGHRLHRLSSCCLLSSTSPLTPGPGISTSETTVLKPGSQRNHRHQLHDRFVLRFSLTQFSS